MLELYLFLFIYLSESSGTDCMLITDGAKLKFSAQCIIAPTSMLSDSGKLVSMLGWIMTQHKIKHLQPYKSRHVPALCVSRGSAHAEICCKVKSIRSKITLKVHLQSEGKKHTTHVLPVTCPNSKEVLNIYRVQNVKSKVVADILGSVFICFSSV